MIDLDELERMAKRVDPLPWKLNLHMGKVVRYTEHGNERFIADCLRVTKRDAHCKRNAAYIVAACNSLPDLIAENRALQERAQMRQELVEQYEKDIARLRQKVRELETAHERLLDENHMLFNRLESHLQKKTPIKEAGK